MSEKLTPERIRTMPKRELLTTIFGGFFIGAIYIVASVVMASVVVWAVATALQIDPLASSSFLILVTIGGAYVIADYVILHVNKRHISPALALSIGIVIVPVIVAVVIMMIGKQSKHVGMQVTNDIKSLLDSAQKVSPL